MAFLALIPALMFAIQGAALKQFSLKCDNSKGANALFTTLFISLSAILSLVLVLVMDGGVLSPDSIVFGAMMGVCFFGIIVFYNGALKLGPLSITSFIFSLSMIVPILVSTVFFGEPFKGTYAIGLILALVSVAMINFSNGRKAQSQKQKIDKRWYLYCVLGFIFNAATLLCNKLHVEFAASPSMYQYLFVNFTVAAMLSAILYIPKSARDSLRSIDVNGWFIALFIMLGFVNVIGNGGSAILSEYLDSVVLFPISNGGTVGISVLLSVFFFRERLNLKAVIGLIIGLAAIVVLSL